MIKSIKLYKSLHFFVDVLNSNNWKYFKKVTSDLFFLYCINNPYFCQNKIVNVNLVEIWFKLKIDECPKISF